MEKPAKWDTIPQGVACHMVALNPNSTEYSEVEKKFVVTMAPLKIQQHPSPSHSKPPSFPLQYSGQWSQGQWSQIIKIERIQNPSLHGQYVVKKKTMDQHNPSTIVNERELFHGCPGDVADKISHHGFNRSFAGRNGMCI